MKVNFQKILETMDGNSVYDMSFEATILQEGLAIRKASTINLSEAALAVDEKKMTVMELLTKRGRPFTLGAFCANLLTGRKRDEGKLEGKDIMARMKLARKTYGAKEPVNIDGDDTDLLRKLIKQAVNSENRDEQTSILLASQALEMLEPRGKELPEKKEATSTIPKE